MVEGMSNCTQDFNFFGNFIYGKNNRVIFPSGDYNIKGDLCNIPTIIHGLINAYVDIMCGYFQSDVICELYFNVLTITCDVSC
jgi:hypothetical protein